MRELLIKMMNDFVMERKGRFAGNAVAALFTSTLPNKLFNVDIFSPEQYHINGSVGKGGWAGVPWVCIFDKDVTTSATNGVYLGFLFAEELNRIYITLTQGITNLKKEIGSQKAIEVMHKTAQDIVEKLNIYDFNSTPKIDFGQNPTERAKMYQEGTILYKAYEISKMPSNESILQDLRHLAGIYYQYKTELLKKTVNPVVDSKEVWLPSLIEYDPHITKEQWLRMLNTSEIFKEKNLLAMACIYDNKGEGSCIALGEKYHQSMTLWRTSCGVHLAARVAEYTKCPLLQEDGKTTYFVVPFLYRKAGSDEDGSWIYKLRPELYDALTEFDILRYLPKKEGEKEVPISDNDAIDKIKSYIAAKGFSYPDGLIENFYLSLKSKPFVILAGTSGTGKTRLVRLFSEAIGATAGNERYKLVSVRPDWSDSSDLFGHVNLKGEFVSGAIIDFVHEASQNTDKPYFLCLDEMNLARVEYYLSDFLSVIETRHRTDQGIETDEVILDQAAAGKYGKVILPENLYVIGTVNMDETTFPFSKKVLDRANTIEFSYVDLEPDFEDQEEEVEPLSLKNDFLKTRYLILKADVPVEQRDLAIRVSRELQEINEILLMANAHVGYRVRDEIVFYMLNRELTDVLTYDVAMDNEIMQKILPRIQGSSASVKEMLCELYKKCAGDYTGLSQASISEQMRAFIDTHECKYRKSAEKISYMMRRYEEDGFTSYWL